MAIRIYNTEKKEKVEFQPLKEGEVSIYVCGPTVYDYLHVGNFRGPVFFNLVRNWFEKRGYRVKYVSNFTDIDDKIITRSLKENVDSLVISERYISEYKSDYQTLSLKKHDANPKVTEHLADIENMISKLIENEKAYEIDGEVLFSVRSFSDYGKLSKRNIDDLRTGTRIQPGEKKRDVLDFSLWKPAKPGEPSWPSPWGPGRPGWHIECSAMIQALFGGTIDIHGGGMDLIFPHHENEIAQSEGATEKPFVRNWMHWNMINFGNQKMSKSLGNVRTAREFLKTYHAEIYKFMILSVHYRSISDFSQDGINRAVSGLARIYSSLAHAERMLETAGGATTATTKLTDTMKQGTAKLEAALDDDFNTPEALAEIFNAVRAYNATIRPGKMTPEKQEEASSNAKVFLEWVRETGKLFSLFEESAQGFLITLDDMLLREKNLERKAIDQKVEERWAAKLSKDFAKSDLLRDELLKLGIAVSDTAEGSRWEVAK